MFGGGSKIKISEALLQKVQVAAQILGCTVEELTEKILNLEADKIIAKTGSKEVSQKEVDEIANKLKGLGYLE